MGLGKGDLKKVPSSMEVRDCYKRIYEWHKNSGKKRIDSKIKTDDEYGKTYLSLLKEIPAPENASTGDMDFIFCQVISSYMEWSYHEPDNFGIKNAAYAHHALQKQYKNGFHDDKARKSMESSKLYDFFYKNKDDTNNTPIEKEQENIGIVLVDNKIRVVSVSKDGAYRFIDGNESTHGILYIASAEALSVKSAIEELECLMNNPNSKESAFQDFFERYPKLITNDEYKRAHSHVTLSRDEGNLIPDFLLEPLDQNSLCDILELKLPTEQIYVIRKNRISYSSAVIEACAQLREYSRYFDEKANRDKITNRYGLLAYKPKMIVIIGRKGDIDPISRQNIHSDIPQLVLRTYDEILSRAKARFSANIG